MRIGIVGLPNSGKSTLFNALTASEVQAENYPFCTIDPNIGVVEVPDERLIKISQIVKPQKVTPATIQFVDIAGLVKGASRGEGLGNQFLSHIRAVDAIAHVVRAFEEENVSHVEGRIDPLRDIEIVNTELILSDLELVEKRLQKLEKLVKTGEKVYREQQKVLLDIREDLEREIPLRNQDIPENYQEFVKGLGLLTQKPVIYVVNINERDLGKQSPFIEQIKEFAAMDSSQVLDICARFEMELAQLEEDEKAPFLEDFDLKEPGLKRLIKKGYGILRLITFFTTTGGKEVRAWTLKQGTPAVDAAGKIHTDIQKGFIRAEVVSYDDLVKTGNFTAAREKGLIRLEGRAYIVEDGDIIHFRFNVQS